MTEYEKMDFVDDFARLSQYEKFCSCSEVNCRCGEQNVHEWTWDSTLATTTSELSKHNLEVKFHPGYSSGTAAVRGNRLMEKGRHHFWEIKMITDVYGTDVMVGVGTNKAEWGGTRQDFCSLLGRDRESWGFSYRGFLQHNGEMRSYSSCFGRGSLVGVHLDTWRGTLQFFLNRKPLGVAFTGLQNMVLYPMACSTAANSKMRITYSSSAPASLQMDCLALLRPIQKAYLTAAFPGLRYLSQSIFANILRKYDDVEEDEIDYPAAFTILDDFDFALIGLGKKRRKKNDECDTCTT